MRDGDPIRHSPITPRKDKRICQCPVDRKTTGKQETGELEEVGGISCFAEVQNAENPNVDFKMSSSIHQ
jgi:hypothetical protein